MLYFTASAYDTGTELSRTDGTPEGTLQVADLVPGEMGSVPEDLVELGGDLFFSAVHPTLGRELWRLADGEPRFLRGDVDDDEVVRLTDLIALLGYLFRRGEEIPCPDAADSDDDGRLTIVDAIVVIRWLFQGGPGPRDPGPWFCWPDRSADALPPCALETWDC